jgi:hypothetical protein
MTKVVGTKIKQGSMTLENGQPLTWDKCRISLLQDNIPGNYGLSAEVLMIKKEDFKRITGLDYADHMKLVDKEVTMDYVLIENKPVLSSLKIVNNK